MYIKTRLLLSTFSIKLQLASELINNELNSLANETALLTKSVDLLENNINKDFKISED